LNEDQLHFLQIARQALDCYDLGDVHIDEHKVVGHIGFFGYTMIKFRVNGATTDFLINVHDAYQGRHIQDYRSTIRSHLLWLEALNNETDLVIQKPVHNTLGDYVTRIQREGERAFLVTLLHWVEGEIVWDDDRDSSFADKPASILYSVGTVLGKLHQHSSQWVLPNGFTRPKSEVEILPENLDRLHQAADEGRISVTDFAVLERVVDRLLDHITSLGESPQTWGLLHGDFSWSNCVMYRNEVRPIDFDWCCFGHFLSDLGWAFALMKPIPAPYCQAFLDGYGQNHKLPDDYLHLVEGFFIEGCIRLLSWRVGSPDQHFPTLSRFVDGAFRKYLNAEPFLLEWMEEL
jgi:Ser/Thr protein kinase RdoA (MazF antagonist)